EDLPVLLKLEPVKVERVPPGVGDRGVAAAAEGRVECAVGVEARDREIELVLAERVAVEKAADDVLAVTLDLHVLGERAGAEIGVVDHAVVAERGVERAVGIEPYQRELAVGARQNGTAGDDDLLVGLDFDTGGVVRAAEDVLE